MTAEVAVDSTVLIFLGKLRRLNDLRDRYDRVVIPPVVHEEVVERGNAIGAADAALVEEAVDTGWVEVVDVDTDPAVERFDLEAGETAVLSLALASDHEVVLADEESVREVARLLGIAPRGTLSFLFAALRTGDLGFDGFVSELESLLEAGFYLDEGVYLEAVRTARELSSPGAD